MKINTVLKVINFYPPLFFAGIKLKKVNADRTQLTVQMKLNMFNKNMFGTHFGGSLYSMCDPFYVFIIAANLGNDYIIWDKSACINFVRPGKGKVQAIFEIPKEKLEEIKNEVDTGKKNFFFETVVTDEKNKIVAEVQKEIYIRKKSK
jgi:acyl-coenzyme A thioesterase PaaI-like protein